MLLCCAAIAIATAAAADLKCLPKDARWYIATTTDCDHEVGLEVIEDALSTSLTQLVHLEDDSISVSESVSEAQVG